MTNIPKWNVEMFARILLWLYYILIVAFLIAQIYILARFVI